MANSLSSPLLARVKSWQLVGLGLTGWCTLYSVALLSWGASSAVVGNVQGGCFAATMTLASFEVKRYRKSAPGPADPFAGLTAQHLNLALLQVAASQAHRIEPLHSTETAMGFGVRTVSAGRTLVFETGRWNEPVIDVSHVQTTDENRKKVYADLAVIVGTGVPDEEARAYVETHPVQLLIGKELAAMLAAQSSVVPEISPAKPSAGDVAA